MKVSKGKKTRVVREPSRANSEQGMYRKLTTIYKDLDEGSESDPIAL